MVLITISYFFILANLGRSDFGTCLRFRSWLGVQQQLNFTIRVEIKSTISVNSNLPNITVTSFDIIGDIVRSPDCHKSNDILK